MHYQHNDLLTKAKTGDKRARNDFIEKNKPFITKAAVKFCRRRLKWENDDELSIAMAAFNEAIDGFESSRGMSFFNFAYLVIHRRLTDYMRSKSKNKSFLTTTGNEECLQAAVDPETIYKDKETDRMLWKEEMQIFASTIKAFNITMEQLQSSSPKHKRVRRKLADLAQKISEDSEIMDYIHRNHKLPLKRISAEYGVSRKFLETWRRYLLILIIIISRPELVLINDYINSLFGKGKK